MTERENGGCVVARGGVRAYPTRTSQDVFKENGNISKDVAMQFGTDVILRGFVRGMRDNLGRESIFITSTGV